MNELKHLFDDIGAQAKSYDVAARAWAGGRRRRYLVRAAPVAVAAVVAVAVVAAVLPMYAGDPRPAASPSAIPTHPADREAERGSLDWLPGRLSYPTTMPRELPRDRGVGPGAIVFGGENRAAPEKILVTSSGAMYKIPLSSERGVDLSPGGRWLASALPDRSALVLRDLTGTTEHRVEGLDWMVRAWSHDERYVVLAGNPQTDAPMRLDLTTGERRSVRGGTPTWDAAGVLPSGEVLFVDVPAEHEQLKQYTWYAVDPASGGRRSGTFDVTGAVTGSEQVRPDLAVLDPQGRTLLVSVSGEGMPPIAALIAVDLTTGRPVVRYNVNPGPDPGSGKLAGFVLAAYRSEGIFVYRYTDRTQEVHVLDPATGQRTLVCEAPPVGIWTRQ